MNPRNHPGQGTDFEVLLPALVSIKLCLNEDVEDFSLDTNVAGFENLDDLLVEVTTKSGKVEKFAFQLKHKENESDALTWQNFEHDRGDFSLKKYYRGYAKIKKKDEYKFILYTNKHLDPEITQESNLRIFNNRNCPGLVYFYANKSNYTGVNKAVYKFEISENEESMDKWEDFRSFLTKLSVYTNQMNASEIYLELKNIFKAEFSSDGQVDSYVTFFREWHNKRFADTKLNMDMIKYKLFDLFLTPHIIQISSMNSEVEDQESDLIHQAIKCFDVTLGGNINRDKINMSLKRRKFEDFQIDRIGFSKKSKGNKFVTRDTNIEKMGRKEKLILENKILWLLYQEPVVIDFDIQRKKTIYAMIRLFAGKIKFILFGHGIDVREFAGLAVFQNLYDLKQKNCLVFEKIAKIFKISLQGRVITLQALKQTVGDISAFITLEDILEYNMLRIGEKEEELPAYVLRNVEKLTLITASLSRIVRDSFIISCGGNGTLLERIREFLQSRPPKTLRKKLYKLDELVDSNQISENAVLLLKECTTEEFYNIVGDVKKGNIHFLKAIDDTNLEWIITKGSIERLHQGEFSKISLSESEIHDRFTKPVNIICARPGMGKTTIMKSLKNQTPSDFWTVKISLIEHNQLFKTAPTRDKILEFFFKLSSKSSLEKRLIEEFLNLKKIIWFFDGVDEMQNESIKNAIICVQMLESMGHKIWISSRNNYQKLLENSFNVLAVDIEELSEDDQKDYIRKRLTMYYTKEQISEIIEKLHTNAKIRDNSHILGIPLQLYMLTEILIISKENLEEDIFILTRMYHHFFKAKMIHYRKKARCTTNIDKDFPINLEKYQLWALKSCLEPDLYKSLNVLPPRHIDEQGIIIKFNEDGTAVFDHNTHADYLIAIRLSKNFEKVPESRRTFIFEDKFENLRFLFDMVLAEQHPVIMATLNKDINTLKQVHENHLHVRDQYGRSALHICCSYGTKCPRVELEECFKIRNVKRSAELYALRVDPKHKKVLKYLLAQKYDPLEADRLLKRNCFQYADLAKSFFSLAKISEICQYDITNLQFYNHTLTVLFYSVLRNFPTLLKMITHKKDFRSIINTKIRTVLEEGTLLHIATKYGHLQIVELLLANGADINIIDEEQRTPVTIAAGHNQLEILNFFMHFTPISLPVASFLGRVDLIQKLLDDGENIDQEDPCYGGGTALFAATFVCNLPVVKYLVEEANANFNWRNRHGYNALHIASEKGDLQVVQYLARLGIDLELMTDFGNTALQLAVKQNHFEVVKYLLTLNAEIRTIDILGQSTLDVSTTREMKTLLEQEITKISSVSLHWSAHHGDKDTIKDYLRSIRKDINNLDGLGRTALYMAAKMGHTETVKLLIDSGALVNVTDDLGDSPLHVATERGHLEVVKVLLEAGADVKQINESGRTPVQMTHKLEILNELGTRRKNEKVFDSLSEFNRAAALGNLDTVKSLLEGLTTVQDFNGQSALHWAAREGHSDVVKFLVESKFVPTLRNKVGHTALYLAIRHRHSSCVQHLIDATEDIEELFEMNNTILHVATLSNSVETVKKLLRKGASVNASNANGKTALHIAVELKHKDFVKLLLENGANVEANDADGLKPINFVYGDKEMMKLLVY